MPPNQGSEETHEEKLTRQFYEWEVFGRGWQIWEKPVQLEPPFRPFWSHHISGSAGKGLDDGRKPTLLSSFAGLFKKDHTGEEEAPGDEWVPNPVYIEGETAITELQIALPAETKITKDAAEQFLLSLGHISRPISFEVIGTADFIVVQIACAQVEGRHIRGQLEAYFPDALVTERDAYLRGLWNEDASGEAATVEF